MAPEEGTGRPTTIAEMRRCLALFVTPASLQAARAFRPLPTDVILSAYPKSGVTWLQQIVHQLRTGGSMDFDEITEVIPWLEVALDMGIDLDAPQPALPRAFKTHMTWTDVPKGGRCIHVLRDPNDVLVSMYRFYEGWRFEPGTISMEAFAREFFLMQAGRARYWHHLATWWRERSRPEVLMLCYEDMKADPAGTVGAVARFIGCDLDEGLLDVVLRQSSVEFMRAHGTKFDDHRLHAAWDPVCGLPPGSTAAKVRRGRVGDHRQELTADVLDAMDAAWRDEIGARFGLPSYQFLRARLAADGAS